MSDDPTLDRIIKKTEAQRSRWALMVVAAVVVVSALIAVVAVGFHGADVRESAAALAKPVPAEITPTPAPQAPAPKP